MEEMALEQGSERQGNRTKVDGTAQLSYSGQR